LFLFLPKGYYGQGIYFSTFYEYALKYMKCQDPAIIISAINLGNTWPVRREMEGEPIEPKFHVNQIVSFIFSHLPLEQLCVRSI